ncbi:MAG: type II/IV secretion system protein [Polyangiaceae bacterium]|nr:type II/IV secretion system protein [Polyangiaceae bacterium]
MRSEITLEALVAALVRERQLEPERARSVLTRQEEQLAVLRRARIAEARLAGSTATTPPAISPLELFLSFGEKGEDDKPIREDAVTEVWARLLHAPYVKLDPLKLDPAFTVRVVSKPFARKHGFLALEEKDGVLKIATYGLVDEWAKESVERVTGKRVELVIASKSDVERLITEFYGFRQSVQRAEQQITGGIDLGNLEQFVRMKSEQEIEASDEHVVHAVDYMFRYAFGQRASDIHIEPKRDDSIVRFRIDGSLHIASRMPRVVHMAVVNRVKMLSRLDIAEKRKPQDGRIRTEFDGKAIDIRVSTLPVAFGEKIVMRIFDPAIVSDDLATLGFFERDKKVFDDLITLPHGILLVTGPTGSGKTTTLYTALRKLACEDVNITTIEDPIENVFEGLNQTAIHPTIGLGFAEILRTILRQDPDIIMVGEIRDLETARHAIQAALTGHLVFSTLHTNDAATAISRLMDLGVQDFLLASTLAGVMAQRLVKKICPDCAAERALTDEEAATIGLDTSQGAILTRYGAGCASCRRTGYLGRSAIVELFRVTPLVRRLIHDRAGDGVIKEQAKKDGMLTLREAAIKKMLMGETTYDQVVEVTSEDMA